MILIALLLSFLYLFDTGNCYSIAMDISQFSKSSPGKLVPVPPNELRPEVTHAFVPNPLPPVWVWPEKMWNLLLEAHKAVSSLNGTGKSLPNTDILIQPLQNREAQLSSKLEGTITEPKLQALFDSEPRYSASAADNSYLEVYNYRRALRVGMDDQSLPLCLRLITDLHKILMSGVRGADKTPGEFRKLQNQIGRPAHFVPPPPLAMAEALHSFEAFLHEPNSGYDPLVKAFLVHYQFETIHPFGDGNGRVGRLLLSLCIAEWCQLSRLWLYMSAYFEANRDEYINRLFAVSTMGDWEGWIEFCLKGVVIQATDAEKRCAKLLELHKDFHGRIKKGSIHAAKIIDLLFKTPAASVVFFKEQLAVGYPTAKRHLESLAQSGVVRKLEGVGQLSYYSPEIYQATHGAT